MGCQPVRGAEGSEQSMTPTATSPTATSVDTAQVSPWADGRKPRSWRRARARGLVPLAFLPALSLSSDSGSSAPPKPWPLSERPRRPRSPVPRETGRLGGTVELTIIDLAEITAAAEAM